MDYGYEYRVPVGVGARPSICISKRDNEEIQLKSTGLSTMIYVSDCKSCEVLYHEKVAKLTIHNCTDMVVRVNSSIICGTLELIGCKNVKIDVQQHGKINTLQTDNSDNLTIALLSHDQLESIYLHKTFSVEVSVGEAGDNKYCVRFPSDVPAYCQFVAQWRQKDGVLDLVCEEVVREGLYPTTETRQQELREKVRKGLEAI